VEDSGIARIIRITLISKAFFLLSAWPIILVREYVFVERNPVGIQKEQQKRADAHLN
jgi:hypothetical protein